MGHTVPLTVGVFVNPTKEQLTEILAAAPLDVVQLHSQETPDFCRWVREHFQVKVFKVRFDFQIRKQIPTSRSCSRSA